MTANQQTLRERTDRAVVVAMRDALGSCLARLYPPGYNHNAAAMFCRKAL